MAGYVGTKSVTLSTDAAKVGGDASVTGTVTAASFVGDGSALTGLPAGYTNGDVDTHVNTSTATSGQYLGWNGSDYAWSTVDLSTKLDLTGGTMTGDISFNSSQTFPAGNLTGTLPALDGSAITDLNAANLTGALPAIDGSSLTGVATEGFPNSSLVATVTEDKNETTSATSGTYTVANDGNLIVAVFAGGGSGGAAMNSNDNTCSVYATGGGSGGYAYAYLSVSQGDTFSYNLGPQAQSAHSGWLRGRQTFSGSAGGLASLTGPNGLSISCTGGGGGGGLAYSSLTTASLAGGTAGTATATGATAVQGTAAGSLVNSVGQQVGASNSRFTSTGGADSGVLVPYVSKNVYSITFPNEDALNYSEEDSEGTDYNITPVGGNASSALAVNGPQFGAYGGDGQYSGGGGGATVMGYVNASSYNAQGLYNTGDGAPPTVSFTLLRLV